jgi:regulator of sigma E protease
MHEFLVSVAAFIVLIAIMVVVHEFGHFAVAKLCKVRVEAFSVGFGPRLFGYVYRGTDYKVSLLPFGGYVKMAGENFGELSDAAAGTATVAPVDDPGALTSHPRWQQMLIGLAGPTANFVLAFVLMVFYFGWINEVPKVEVKSTTVEWVVPGSLASQAGFEAGDIILHFGDADRPDWEKVYERIKLNPDQTLPVAVERSGATLQLSLHVPMNAKSDAFDVGDIGLLPQFTYDPLGVKEVTTGSPADRAGLRAGDGIQSVDGIPVHTVTTLLAYMQTGKGKPLSIVVVRNGAAQAPIVAFPTKLDEGWKLGFIPVQIPSRHDPLPFSKAVFKSTTFCADKSFMIFEVLGGLFTHKVAVSQLAGPVGIARMAGDAAEMKSSPVIFGLAAMISLNLGIINLMPFPILDGGMILFLLIESTIRREININVKERIYQAAFVALMVLMAFLTFNDVAKLPFFTHLKP